MTTSEGELPCVGVELRLALDIAYNCVIICKILTFLIKIIQIRGNQNESHFPRERPLP